MEKLLLGRNNEPAQPDRLASEAIVQEAIGLC
jgi:hypothetical protein